jgi:hypothetical protein
VVAARHGAEEDEVLGDEQHVHVIVGQSGTRFVDGGLGRHGLRGLPQHDVADNKCSVRGRARVHLTACIDREICVGR